MPKPSEELYNVACKNYHQIYMIAWVGRGDFTYLCSRGAWETGEVLIHEYIFPEQDTEVKCTTRNWKHKIVINSYNSSNISVSPI